MAKYKVLPIALALKNNEIAKHGDIVEGNQLASNAADLVEQGFLEEISEKEQDDAEADRLKKEQEEVEAKRKAAEERDREAEAELKAEVEKQKQIDADLAKEKEVGNSPIDLVAAAKNATKK